MLTIVRCRIVYLPLCYQRNISIKIPSAIILSVLYGFETWPLNLREERRLRVFENRVPRKIFGPKMDEVTGGGGEKST
jgi:hypothetical protein